ncbi:MAG: hypothetical protein M9938_02735 [Solirubrobacterales bacterium]|nr:hypothetical protein [Solirubrobacterales bacterium]
MKRAATALAITSVALLAFAGCGGESGNDAADEQAIRDLITQVNQATANRDAGAACDLIAPSSLEETFNTRARCITETGAILKQAGDQPPVEVESIEISGDRASVTLKGRNDAVDVVREDGRWYLPISSETETDSDSVAPAENQ